MLQPNRIFPIAGFDGAAKFTHMVDYAPTPTLTPEFGVVLCYNLAQLPNLVAIRDLGAFYDALHYFLNYATRCRTSPPTSWTAASHAPYGLNRPPTFGMA